MGLSLDPAVPWKARLWRGVGLPLGVWGGGLYALATIGHRDARWLAPVVALAGLGLAYETHRSHQPASRWSSPPALAGLAGLAWLAFAWWLGPGSTTLLATLPVVAAGLAYAAAHGSTGTEAPRLSGPAQPTGTLRDVLRNWPAYASELGLDGVGAELAEDTAEAAHVVLRLTSQHPYQHVVQKLPQLEIVLRATVGSLEVEPDERAHLCHLYVRTRRPSGQPTPREPETGLNRPEPPAEPPLPMPMDRLDQALLATGPAGMATGDVIAALEGWRSEEWVRQQLNARHHKLAYGRWCHHSYASALGGESGGDH